MDADSRIIAALAEPSPAEGAPAAVLTAWDHFTAKRDEYRECVATHRSTPDLTLAMSAEVAAKQLIEEHLAYRLLSSASSAAPGTAPELLASPRGFTVDFRRLYLHNL